MSTTPSWDRAGLVPAPGAGRPSPEIAALRDELPSVDELFTFMRDAELRFETLRMRIEEHAWNTRGEERSVIEVSLRHPGEVKVLSSIPAHGTTGSYDVWVSDGATVQTYVASRKVGTRRPVRPMVRGVADHANCRAVRVYVPAHSLGGDAAELFIHPRLLSEELATGCARSQAPRWYGREASCRCPPGAIELVADVGLPDRSRWTGRRLIPPPRGVDGRRVTRDAIVTSYVPSAAAARRRVQVPATTIHLLRRPARSARSRAPARTRACRGGASPYPQCRCVTSGRRTSATSTRASWSRRATSW